MSLSVLSSGEMPPCMHKNWSLTTAANGKLSKHAVAASYTRMEYLCSPNRKLVQFHLFVVVVLKHTYIPF